MKQNKKDNIEIRKQDVIFNKKVPVEANSDNCNFLFKIRQGLIEIGYSLSEADNVVTFIKIAYDRKSQRKMQFPVKKDAIFMMDAVKRELRRGFNKFEVQNIITVVDRSILTVVKTL